MNCKHKHKKFVMVSNYQGFPERIYSCQDCGTMVSDFASDEELNEFQLNGSATMVKKEDLSNDMIHEEMIH
jgi:hypothetical protein